MPSDTSNAEEESGLLIKEQTHILKLIFSLPPPFFFQLLCFADLAAEWGGVFGGGSAGGLIRRLALMTLSPGPSGLLMDGGDVFSSYLPSHQPRTSQKFPKGFLTKEFWSFKGAARALLLSGKHAAITWRGKNALSTKQCCLSAKCSSNDFVRPRSRPANVLSQFLNRDTRPPARSCTFLQSGGLVIVLFGARRAAFACQRPSTRGGRAAVLLEARSLLCKHIHMQMSEGGVTLGSFRSSQLLANAHATLSVAAC